MAEIRELNLQDQRDFDLMVVHVEKLYTELFGPSAVPQLASLAALREEIARQAPPHWAFLGQDADAEPVSFVTLAESFAIFARGTYGIINELWVRPDGRSQGVGAQVLEHCKAFGRRRGWQRIDVSAPAAKEWDRSAAFYERNGFELTGRKLKCLLDRQPSAQTYTTTAPGTT